MALDRSAILINSSVTKVVPVRLEVMLAMVLIASIYAPTVADLAAECWSHPNASQGVLVLALVLWLAWTNRRTTFARPIAPSPTGLLLISASSIMFLIGKLGAEFFLQRFSLVMLLAGLVWMFWGTGRLRSLALPLILLAGVIPIPLVIYNDLTQFLQLFTSDLSARLIHLCGTEVLRDGNIIRLSRISLGVGEACSGLNGLSTLMLTSLVLSGLQRQGMAARIILVAVSVPIGIGVNVLRITCTALLADRHEAFAVGLLHYSSGMIVFLLGFTALVMAARLLWLSERDA